MTLNPEKTGLSLAAFAAAAHVLWAALVSFGWAGPIVNFMLRAHFVTKPTYTIGAFDLGTAFVLVIIAAAVGYVAGFAFAHIWNWTHEQTPS